MRSRALGLRRVSVSVDVESQGTEARAAFDKANIRTALCKQIAAEGIDCVANGQADRWTLLVRVRADCSAGAPQCAAAVLYSRFSSENTRENAPESFVWLVGPSILQSDSWPRVARDLASYSSEAAIIAAGLVRK